MDQSHLSGRSDRLCCSVEAMYDSLIAVAADEQLEDNCFSQSSSHDSIGPCADDGAIFTDKLSCVTDDALRPSPDSFYRFLKILIILGHYIYLQEPDRMRGDSREKDFDDA